jgi:carbon monoxide dehydrogenase subunit G
MKLSGYEHFDAPVETVFDQLTNLEFTAKTLPGLERVDKITPTHLECRVKPPLGFLAGSMQMVFDVLEANRPSSARMQVKGKGIGASVTIETSIKLSPEMEGTRLEWNSQITELGGLIKALSRSLIEGAAKKIVTDSWVTFRKHLEQMPR